LIERKCRGLFLVGPGRLLGVAGESPEHTDTTLSINDVTDDDPELALPDVDVVYANYLETCRRLGVEPMSVEKAHALITDWNRDP
jgi:hypothetical protein